ncbi:MAG: tRNA lysidine(34) synthetase TilS [Akkermansiaceae bacterium]|jgi:tRNA(Ile)-lysidine synthase|nr:tRNA lysidine(34) synthetase TilS [Akkermansiaceae bacterium]
MDDAWFSQASRSKRYLVGVSGGADSVALLEMLLEKGFRKLVVCHLDHGWRGKESRADARWVADLAGKHGLDFTTEQAEMPMGSAMEARARQARHEFFGRCAKAWKCPRLLLAHHAQDQAETVLWNLLRGSHGETGMAMRREMAMGGRKIEVIRPLLAWKRAELRAWLTERNLTWREDATNALPIAVRNRLRHEALPLLEEISGRDAVDALTRAAEKGAALREIEAWAVREAAAVDPQGRLHLGRLKSLPPALRRACVFSHLSTAGIADLGTAELERVMSMLEPGGPPRVSLPGGKLAHRRGGRLWIA